VHNRYHSRRPCRQARTRKRLGYFEKTDMAVVVSQSQNEIEEFQKKGLQFSQFSSHRKRMVKKDLETKFKNLDDPLRIVFVCAMWITGFDVPSCSTIYLDKPMKNHTLMQSIARANRVWKDKQNGLIVDYVGIFRNLQKALAIYGNTAIGGEMPIKDKDELVRLLRAAIQKALVFSHQHGVKLDKILTAAGFEREKLKDDAVAAFVLTDDIRHQFFGLARNVEKIFKSLLPDPTANQFGSMRKMLAVIVERIRCELGVADISGIMEQIAELLDESISPQGYVIRPSAAEANTLT
jgi:type I restriction enzyme R subunit